MAATATATAWHWVIDALASIERVGASYLRALIVKVPNFWTEAPQSVRERVALKYIEEGCPSTSSLNPAIGEDRSREDDFRSLLEKVATSGNIGKGGAELFGHDLCHFVLRRRSALPKPCPELLKELILEGHAEAVLSLKERSGLSIPGQAEYPQFNSIGEHERVKKRTISTRVVEDRSQLQASVTLAPDSGNLIGEHECVKKLKVNNTDGEARSQLQPSVTLSPDSDNLILQKEPFGLESHLPKQNLIVDGKIDDPQRNVTASKSSGVQPLHGSIDQLPGEKSTSCIDIEIKLSGSRHQCTEMNVSNRDGESISQFLTRSSMPLTSHKGNSSLQHAPFSGRGKSVNQPLRGADHLDDELSDRSGTPSDSGLSGDLPSNFDLDNDLFVADKHRLLNSQIRDHDSVDNYWSQQDLCIKCDKGGELLSCSTKGCLIVVHKNCVGPLPDPKGTNLFYCPFCLFSRANYEYHKARRNISRARKALSMFVDKDSVRGQSKKLGFANIPRERNQAGISGNKICQQSSRSCDQQTDKSNSNLVEGKRQQRETKTANLSRHAKDSLYVDTCNVSHDTNEVDNATRAQHCLNDAHDANEIGNITKAQHCLNDAANVVNSAKLPCHLKVASSICENAELGVNIRSEVGNDWDCNTVEHQQIAHLPATTNNDNLSHEEDKYEISHRAVSKAKGNDEDILLNDHPCLEKFKGHEKIKTAYEHDAVGDASTSHAKRRNNAVTDNIHCTEGTSKMRKSEKPSSDNTNKLINLKNQEQISTDAIHDTDFEAVDPLPSERYRKRRGDAAIGKTYHPREAVANPKSEKSPSNHSRRRAGQPKNHSHCGVSLGRRQRLFWTDEEEETLKDAVRKLAVDGDKNLPWKTIYEYGQHVFQSRNPGDLKDKWRNMMKRYVKEEM